MAKQFILENASPSTRLLEKRRQMFEVQEALELQKQEFARKVCAHSLQLQAGGGGNSLLLKPNPLSLPAIYARPGSRKYAHLKQ